MPWYFSHDSGAGEAETLPLLPSLPLAPVVLVPVALLILLQFISTPRKTILSSLFEASLARSTLLLGGTLVLLLGLIWLHSTWQSIWE
ncbi:hypothetical protein O6H91_16G022200 [Diphasiastrum complanatum]|nr:hypothetical protein O6H91_16G022200 [Diphasiastrum complanatum]